MATSITAAGIVFPDSSVQTTAASASGGTTEAIASGSLSNGSTVVVNTDGTVSVVAGVSWGVGTPVVFETSDVTDNAIVYNASSSKVVVVYRDTNNSNYGTAIIGTVSGTSISFGTAVVFASSGVTSVSICDDTVNGKVVIAYTNGGNSNYGTAIVGTVSGTTISFGSATVFQSSFVTANSCSYNATSQKAIIGFCNTNNSFYGTAVVGTVSGTSISFGSSAVFLSEPTAYVSGVFDAASGKTVFCCKGTSNFGRSVVGTISGTSISFGTPVTFASAATNYINAVYDSTNNKVVAAYQDTGNSNYGTAIVGTVSGTSISFGTEVVFRNVAIYFTSAAYDTANNKVTISYRDDGNSEYGTTIAGTVSGTSINFSTSVVFESASTEYTSSTYDSVNQKVVVAYRDRGNSNRGTSVVLQTGYSNLTSENFIGFSNAAYTNGQTATIQIAGAVDDAQSGLTPGQAYYVQTNGTLGLTPGTPSVFAGTAIAATKIVVQG